MSTPAVLNNTALLIPQQQRASATARPVADASHASIDAVSSPLAGSALMPADELRSLFSVNSLNVTATKVRLMERAGKEFAIDQADYESVFSYGSAIKDAVEAMKQQSPSAIAEIERQLGLDQLGIALDTLANAIFDPQGSDGDRLDAELTKEAGEQGEGKSSSILPDEIGLYGG